MEEMYIAASLVSHEISAGKGPFTERATEAWGHLVQILLFLGS